MTSNDDRIYVGQYGTEIRLECDPPSSDGKWYESDGETERDPIDISGASSYKILVKTPSGEELEWDASQYLTTTQIAYTTQDGDLDEIGKYKLQALVEWSNPAMSIPGRTVSLRVYARYK